MWDQHLFYEINNNQSPMTLDYFFCIYAYTKVIVEILVIVRSDWNVSPDFIRNGITIRIVDIV